MKKEPEKEIIIGNKPEYVKSDNGDLVQTEPYLRVILDKLSKFDYIYIKTRPHPEKLNKVNGIYEYLKWFGVKEQIGNRKFIYEVDKKNPDTKIKVLLIKWEIIPRLQSYRQDLLNEIKDETE